MLDTLCWYATTLLLWSAYWGWLCLLLCAGRLRKAPRLLGMAALVCALRQGIAVLPPWYAWAHLLGLASRVARINALYQPLDWAQVACWLLLLLSSKEVLSLLLLGGVVYGLKWVTPAEVGLRGPRPGTGPLVGLVVAAVATGVVLGAYFTRQAAPARQLPEQLFIAVLPGLAEELFYRGVLLGLLSRVFVRRLPLPGTHTSWGGVVGVVLFALAHGLKLEAYQMEHLLASNLHVSLQGWYHWRPLWHSSAADQLYYLAMGTLLLWARERTGSVWAAVGAHCLLNTAVLLRGSLG